MVLKSVPLFDMWLYVFGLLNANGHGGRNGLCRDLENNGTLRLTYPGKTWLGSDWNDNVRSYQCFTTT